MSYLERENETLREALGTAKATMAEQHELIARLTAPPTLQTLVVSITESDLLGATTKEPRAVVIHEGKRIEVLCPDKLEIEPGTWVRISSETLQIIEVLDAVDAAGEISIIRALIDDGHCEIAGTDQPRVVLTGSHSESLEVGDRVILDSSQTVILENLGKDEQRFAVKQSQQITWDQIGGLDDAKQAMIEAIELPHTHPEIFNHYGKKPSKGILLHGPPGCGKTLLAKAAASSLSRIFTNEDAGSSGYIYVKGPEILDRFVGVAEATIRQIFERARAFKQEHGYPAVVFIDEADAILGRRGSGISSDIERTTVPMFLAEMDGLEDSGALLILATNRPDILDPAVVRDGRMDRKIKVDRPNQGDAETIFGLHLSGRPLLSGKTHSELATQAAAQLYSSEHRLFAIDVRTKVGRSERIFTLGHVASGAMIHGVVEKAASSALQRDIKTETLTGISIDDLIAAVALTLRETEDLDHTDAIEEFIHDFKDDVVGVSRLSQSTN